MVSPEEGWCLIGLLAQDLLRLNEYLFRFQLIYVEEAVQVLSYAATR